MGVEHQAVLGAQAIVDDHYGEGPIAFPELHESVLRRTAIDSRSAVDVARSVLMQRLEAGAISIHRGRALDGDLPVVDPRLAMDLLTHAGSYRYGDGSEMRAWFQIPADHSG